MGNANSSQTRRRRRTGNGAEMFAGFQPGTQVGLGVGRPGARVGAGRPGARRWIMPPTVDRNHLDTMDPATYALVRDMLTRQYLAAHGPVHKSNVAAHLPLLNHDLRAIDATRAPTHWLIHAQARTGAGDGTAAVAGRGAARAGPHSRHPAAGHAVADGARGARLARSTQTLRAEPLAPAGDVHHCR